MNESNDQTSACAARLATVDAVTGHIIEATMSLEARGMPLKGALVKISSDGDTVIGRIDSIDLTNLVHQNDAFAPYIMMNGAVPHWSKDVDIERAKIEVIGVLDSAGEKIPMRRNPSSGTPVFIATRSDIDRFSKEKEHYLVTGYVPNSRPLIPASIINRHHGDVGSGGYGEARHTVILGQNGSGKTVFATMLMAGKLAAHPEMGMLMPDTQGDISDPTRHNRGSFEWNYKTVLDAVGVKVEIIDVNDIRLTSQSTLKGRLAKFLMGELNMTKEKATDLFRIVVDQLLEEDKDVSAISLDGLIETILQTVPIIYTKATSQEKINNITGIRDNPGRRSRFERVLKDVFSVFQGSEKIDTLVRQVLEQGRKVIINIGAMSGTDQVYVMHEVMTQLRVRAQIVFQKKQKSCNALVLLDEGRTWIPEGETTEIGEAVKKALRETRKCGVGWMIISQSPSGISKDVLRESHTKYFGRGLGIGVDLKHLQDTLGKTGLEAYEQLEIQGGYFWIGIGHDNNIGSESRFFAIHPVDGNATARFMKGNPHIFRAI